VNEALHRLISYWLWTMSRLASSFVNASVIYGFDKLIPALKISRLTFIQLLLSLLVLIGTSGSLPTYAQEAQAADLTMIAANPKVDSTETLPVEFMNRQIFTIRSEFMGYTQEERAMAVRSRIKTAMEKGGGDRVSFRPTPEGGRFVELNGLAVFQIRPNDLDPLIGESIDEAAKTAAQNLKIAVGEAREQSNTHVMLIGIGFFVLASVRCETGVE
jgi:hypothetical protein